MTDFISILEERGFINQCTDLEGLRRLARAQAINFYIGFDATADSLHVGSLIQIMVMKWAKELNVPFTILIGGFTTRVGDPTGKSETRPVLSDDQIKYNEHKIESLLISILDARTEPDILVNNNRDWFDDYEMTDFADISRKISVNRLLALDTMKTRLEAQQHLSLLELLYPAFQAIDFCELALSWRVNTQIGGSDQWGNITMGVELARKEHDRDLFGLTTPLLTNSAGEKMGKTTSGTVWLSADKTSPFDFWQFWRNVEDEKVGAFLTLFSMEPFHWVKGTLASGINDAKVVLADTVTRMIHGEEILADVRAQVEATFKGGSIENLKIDVIDTSHLGFPFFMILAGLLGESNSEVKRLIASRAVKVNDRLIIDPRLTGAQVMQVEGNDTDGEWIIRVGKQKVFRIAFDG